MKKTVLGLLILVSFYANAQEYKLEEKTVTGVFDVAGKSKSEIFSAISKWISINYNSGKSVTQLSDAEGGNIIVKGINETTVSNNARILYPNTKSIPDTSIMKFNHLIEINIKDNKYRIIYRIIDIYYEPSEAAYLTAEMIKMNNDCINLIGVPDSTILLVSDFTDANLKKGLVGKEKREKYIQALKPMYDKLNSDIVNDMKTTMLLINKSITATSEGW